MTATAPTAAPRATLIPLKLARPGPTDRTPMPITCRRAPHRRRR